MPYAKKNRPMKSKLSRRLTIVYALLFIVILLVLSMAIFFVATELLVQRRTADIKASMPMILENILHEMSEGDTLDHGGMLSEQNVNPDMNMFLRDTDGIIINREYNFKMDEASLPTSPEEPDLLFLNGKQLFITYEQPVVADGEIAGSLYLVLNLQREWEFLRILILLLLCANAIGVVAAFTTGRITSRRMLAPIQDMIHTANSIDEGSLEERLEVPKPDDELKQLALTINNMLSRVEAAFVRQGEFAANASHELRTPLAILQGNAELLARWGQEDPKVLKESIDAILQQTTYMNALVENLLFLARSDSAEQGLNKESFSLSELLKELAEEQRRLDKNHVYSVGAEMNCMLYADRTMVKEMLRALLDNSIKFTPTGGEITLLCRREIDRIILAVHDTGAGMSEEHIAHIFERFYRVDKARSRATGGMGLGLSIVHAIIQLHNGTIDVKSALGEGTEITVVFPQQEP